jgi:putative ATPase
VKTSDVTLVGAPTENPSPELTGALLSRRQVFGPAPLDAAALETLSALAETFEGRPSWPLKAHRGRRTVL